MGEKRKEVIKLGLTIIYLKKSVWLFFFTHPLSLLVLPTPGEEMVLEKVVWPLSALNLGAFRDIIRAPPPPFLLIFWPLEGAVTVSADISDESNLFSPLDLLEPVKKEPMTDRMVIPKNWVLHFRSIIYFDKNSYFLLPIVNSKYPQNPISGSFPRSVTYYYILDDETVLYLRNDYNIVGYNT